jgi:hypothetical protein
MGALVSFNGGASMREVGAGQRRQVTSLLILEDFEQNIHAAIAVTTFVAAIATITGVVKSAESIVPGE